MPRRHRGVVLISHRRSRIRDRCLRRIEPVSSGACDGPVGSTVQAAASIRPCWVCPFRTLTG
ncbi:hypothetical protein ACIBF6_13425 [Streptosporangium amethystogenes]|uniref:hypothetical protein n=1 Tax=Streptosporangium amethystogenes TaxID=2002 RepID=UPI0037B9A2FC